MPVQGQILVIRGGAIGDFILTLPVLRALREQFPWARLEVLGYPHIASLAEAGGLVDASRSIDARALASFFSTNLELPSELAGYFSCFAVIFSYLYDPDGIFQDNVRRCTSGQFIAGPHRPDDAGSRHATDVLLQPLQRLAIFDADPVPQLKIPPGDDAGPPWLALHPGSGSDTKNWPDTKWRELIVTLAETTDHRFLLVGGEAEGERLRHFENLLPAARRNVARQRPLPEVARLLAGCRAFVGHDSGITHLAASVGTPSLVLWGPTARQVWCPLGDHVRILEHPDGLAALPVVEVLRECLELMGEGGRR